MGLSNASKKARNYTSTSNQDQGGGAKKAGFAYQVGRGYMVENWFDQNGVNRPLPQLQNTVFPLATITRPIGRNNNRTYWDRGTPP